MTDCEHDHRDDRVVWFSRIVHANVVWWRTTRGLAVWTAFLWWTSRATTGPTKEWNEHQSIFLCWTCSRLGRRLSFISPGFFTRQLPSIGFWWPNVYLFRLNKNGKTDDANSRQKKNIEREKLEKSKRWRVISKLGSSSSLRHSRLVTKQKKQLAWVCVCACVCVAWYF